MNAGSAISAILTQVKLEFNRSISSLVGEGLQVQIVLVGQPIMIGAGAVIEDEAYFLMVKPAISIWHNI